MTAATIETPGNLLTITVRGQLKKEEYDRLLRQAEPIIGQKGRIKLLIVGEGFAGWERASGWGDLGFMMEHDDDIGKIAVVAEERWRDDLLMFLGAGLRAAPVCFFTPDQLELARAWLADE